MIHIALFCAGLDATLSFNTDILRLAKTIVMAIQSQTVISNDSKNLEDRAKIIICAAKFVPSKVSNLHKVTSIVELIKMKKSTMTTNMYCLAGLQKIEWVVVLANMPMSIDSERPLNREIVMLLHQQSYHLHIEQIHQISQFNQCLPQMKPTIMKEECSSCLQFQH